MKIKSLYVLLIILLASTLFVFSVYRPTGSDDNYQERWELLPTNNPQDITKFVYKKSDAERIEIEQSDSGWIITYPIKTEGSKFSIDLMIKSIISSRLRAVFYNVTDLSHYGLENPECQILLFSKISSKPDTLHIGDKTPTSDECYFRINSSNDVMLSPDIPVEFSEKTLFHLRNKMLIDIDKDNINKLTFRSSKGDFTIDKSKNSWDSDEISVPSKDVSMAENNFLESLSKALIYQFPSENNDNLEAFGLENPDYSITIETLDEEITIYFGDRLSDKIYARKSNRAGVLLIKSDILAVFN
ncbi:MAG TPA: DUF4340 domain-containing protein [Candidatus Krumholzibacteriaceae bacterium]|nr:DUF4340 domain-containing protein [Candidatus Krumholzibacteriaceae bacterium]